MAAKKKKKPPQDRVREEHARIFKLVGSIERLLSAKKPTDAWLNELSQGLLELAQHLAPHFRFERDAVREGDDDQLPPHLLPELRRLMAEHELFLADLGAILALARGALDPTPALVKQLAARTRALFDGLRRHEEAETDLLFRAFQEELGAGD